MIYFFWLHFYHKIFIDCINTYYQICIHAITNIYINQNYIWAFEIIYYIFKLSYNYTRQQSSGSSKWWRNILRISGKKKYTNRINSSKRQKNLPYWERETSLGITKDLHWREMFNSRKNPSPFTISYIVPLPSHYPRISPKTRSKFKTKYTLIK